MIWLHRFLQLAGVAALLMCAELFWSASPWGGEGWARGRLLYAGAGTVSALTLIAIGGLGLALSRARADQERMARRLEEIQAALRSLQDAAKDQPRGNR
jgi:hypothetical protein